MKELGQNKLGEQEDHPCQVWAHARAHFYSEIIFSFQIEAISSCIWAQNMLCYFLEQPFLRFLGWTLDFGSIKSYFSFLVRRLSRQPNFLVFSLGLLAA